MSLTSRALVMAPVPLPPAALSAPAVGGQVVDGAAEVAFRVAVDPVPVPQHPLQGFLQQVLTGLGSSPQQRGRPQQRPAAPGEELFESGHPPIRSHAGYLRHVSSILIPEYERHAGNVDEPAFPLDISTC
jgi:hypothetical protein